jgi:hypothetical protein
MTEHGMNKEFERRVYGYEEKPRMTFCGCLCCHTGFDFFNWPVFCFSQGDCLCLRQSVCISPATVEPRGIGMVTKKEHGEICKVGCYCCDCGLVKPQRLCAQSSQFLCCYNVQQFPLGQEHQSKMVCAFPCLQFLPTCGCAAE